MELIMAWNEPIPPVKTDFHQHKSILCSNRHYKELLGAQQGQKPASSPHAVANHTLSPSCAPRQFPPYLDQTLLPTTSSKAEQSGGRGAGM